VGDVVVLDRVGASGLSARMPDVASGGRPDSRRAFV
jgi:hypothetical protein